MATTVRASRSVMVLAMMAVILAKVISTDAAAGSVADEIKKVDESAGREVEKVEPLLTSANATGALPTDPTQALINNIEVLSEDLGFRQEADAAIHLAQLPDEIEGRLANVLQDLSDCHRITSAHFATIKERIDGVARDGGGLDAAEFVDIRQCAVNLWASTTALERSINSLFGPNLGPDGCKPAGTSPVDLWPVLRFEGTCSATAHTNDYVLTVELGGHDTYTNNIGSNMIDLNYSPTGSLVVGRIGTGSARGCQLAIGGPNEGGISRGDCVPSASVLLDMRGQDTYGVKETPDVDKACTRQAVIRRMVSGGVGFLGAGILRDAGSTNDTYTGKTVSLGSGHVFGVGMLSDQGGNDAYSSVRNSQGFALVGGVGILHDERGDDKYDFYMPGPDGVIDDEGVCDADPRFMQGGANVLAGTIGMLLEDAGNDTYIGGSTETFSMPGDEVTLLRGGSQGFGNNLGVGILFDRAGTDSYNSTGPQGAKPKDGGWQPQRANNMQIPPDPECKKSTCSGGVFVDR